MLPFMKKKPIAGLIIAQRKPDGGTDIAHEEGDENHALDACSEDMIRAMHAKDIKALSAALRAAYEVLQSEPSMESDGSYDDQNALAAKEER